MPWYKSCILMDNRLQQSDRPLKEGESNAVRNPKIYFRKGSG